MTALLGRSVRLLTLTTTTFSSFLLLCTAAFRRETVLHPTSLWRSIRRPTCVYRGAALQGLEGERQAAPPALPHPLLLSHGEQDEGELHYVGHYLGLARQKPDVCCGHRTVWRNIFFNRNSFKAKSKNHIPYTYYLPIFVKMSMMVTSSTIRPEITSGGTKNASQERETSN